MFEGFEIILSSGDVFPSFYAGVVGDLIREHADVAVNSRFIIDYGTDEIEFLYPVVADLYCVIAPAALPRPKWSAMFRCFRTSIWNLLLFVQCLTALVWFGFQVKSRIRKGRNRWLRNRLIAALFSTMLDVYQLMLSHPIRLPVQNRERAFLAIALMTNVIFVGIFQVSNNGL